MDQIFYILMKWNVFKCITILVMFIPFGAYGSRPNLELYCKDPDTDEFHASNTTWSSTTFCGNYSCAIRKKGITQIGTINSIFPARMLSEDDTNRNKVAGILNSNQLKMLSKIYEFATTILNETEMQQNATNLLNVRSETAPDYKPIYINPTDYYNNIYKSYFNNYPYIQRYYYPLSNSNKDYITRSEEINDFYSSRNEKNSYLNYYKQYIPYLESWPYYYCQSTLDDLLRHYYQGIRNENSKNIDDLKDSNNKDNFLTLYKLKNAKFIPDKLVNNEKFKPVEVIDMSHDVSVKPSFTTFFGKKYFIENTLTSHNPRKEGTFLDEDFFQNNMSQTLPKLQRNSDSPKKSFNTLFMSSNSQPYISKDAITSLSNNTGFLEMISFKPNMRSKRMTTTNEYEPIVDLKPDVQNTSTNKKPTSNDTMESYIKIIRCDYSTEIGFFRSGNSSETYPKCCPQKIV